MMASPNPRNVLPKVSAKRVPDVLVHEIIDGIPYYRKGYKEVLAKTKTIQDIMGSSSLQAFIITYLIVTIGKQLDEALYSLLANEAGLHLDKRNNVAGDLLIFDNKTLTINQINKKYAAVPPKICMEVDVDIVTEHADESIYIMLKTKKLLDFGAEKVIWFFTESKKVMIATSDADWQLHDWNNEIEVLDGITCNVGKYLKDKGSEFA
ncbi:Uma2 family endonuclease [Dyadobacter sp. CY323]|uniref:Uma2 family endonuclease n=1 Tax=Dyadobacter sp. CY323 TaxID=2907302 RepID=UPI001F236771|nr:Uma2 family endonuclease [Dyadobacter sp. CY323]MCE6988685.1 Uma2 family endonuclease [Dyadobacter sp. CY323]